MNAHARLLGPLLCAGMLAATAASAGETASTDFIKTAIQGNLAEIAAGKLAHEKGASAAVKSFGQMLVDDHTKANQDATEVAKGMGVALPTAPNDEQLALYQKLSKEPGKAFDTDFVNAMLQDHQKAIDAYQKAASESKDAAGQYASKTLPALQQHLSEAQSVAKGMGI